MPEVIRSKVKAVLNQEFITPSNVEISALKSAATTVFAEHPFTIDDADWQEMASRASLEGLTTAEVRAAFQEVRRHISVESYFTAYREHETKRSAAGKNIFKHIRFNFKDGLTVFGGGVAADVRQKEQTAFTKPAELKALMNSALELGIMRRRLNEYRKLGGAPLQDALQAFKDGQVFANGLLDKTTEHGQKYDAGLDVIVASLNLKVGGKFELDGMEEIPIDTEDTKAAIEHHVKFILRTEIMKLAEAEELTVLSSEEYNIGKPTNAWQKAWQVGKGVVSSGTFWGVTTRFGTRLAIGGVMGATAAAGFPALVGGMVVGVAAGAAGAYMREKFNAKQRLKRRRLEAALGGIDDSVVKPAHAINQELVAGAKALAGAGTDESRQIVAIKQAFTAASDAQARLRSARTATKSADKQDYISFGVENRFKAQTQLLENLEKTLSAIQLAMEALPRAQQEQLRQQLIDINTANSAQLTQAKDTLTHTISVDQARQQRRAAMIGGIAGGLGSVVSHYALELFGAHHAAEAATHSTPGALAEPTKLAPEHVIAGSEELNTVGKSVFIDAHGDHYDVSFDQEHQLVVTRFANDQDAIESVTKADFSNVDSDDLQVVHTDTGVRVFDDQGQPVADVAFGDGGTGGDITEQIFADPETKQMLDAMGLQPSELQYDPQTKLFHIPDDALHDAAGKPEYLGQTAGWRARRLEFILKAMAEGKTTETPEMIVARAERATANLLLKSPMHGDSTAAFNEAFTKDAGFIQKNIMPWIDGHRSRVSERWMQLVAEMKTQQLSVTADGEGGVVITPLNQDGTVVETAAAPTAGETAFQMAGDWGVDMSSRNILPLMGAILGTAVVESAARALTPKSDISKDSARNQEYSGDDDTEVVMDKPLPDVTETAAAIKQEGITKSVAEKGPAIKAEIAAFIAAADTAVGAKRVTLDTLRTTMLNESFAQTHIDALVAEAGSFAAMQAKLTEAKALLAKEDGGVNYSDVDAAAGNELTVWIAAQEEVLQVVDVVKEKVKDKIEGTAAVITTIRKDKDKNTTTRRNELKTCLSDLAVVNSLSSIVPSIISDAAWQTAMETAAQAARTEAEQAIAIITVNEYISKDAKVAVFVNAELNKRGCFNPTEPTLPQPDKTEYIVKLAKKMETYSENKTGLEQMGFMTTVGGKSFESKHEARITQVLDRLFNDVDDIFAK